jgi:alpha-acetolactate decarboxylase
MDKLLDKSNKPKTPPVPPTATSDEVQKQIEKNLRDRNTMSPEDFFGTKPVFSSSLNSIPGNEQMQIASETQEQFSFDNAKGEIVALYQPTVYYTES